MQIFEKCKINIYDGYKKNKQMDFKATSPAV